METPEVRVRVEKLDEWVAAVPGVIDVLKIDVEGFEPFVLEEAEGLLKRTNYLFFEYRKSDVETNKGLAHLFDQLKGFPYLYGIDERKRHCFDFFLSDFSSKRYIIILASKTKLINWR